MDVKGMREIRFRGKRIDNGEWVEGYFVNLWLMHYQKHQPIITDNNAVSYDVDPSTVGQYTGLTDKNGKKIFEGDIVDASNEWWNSAGPAGHDSPVILVEGESDLCGFEPFANYDCDCGVYINAKNCEVLGNIHDNPELLEDFNKEA